jgi:hypothetical protein
LLPTVAESTRSVAFDPRWGDRRNLFRPGSFLNEDGTRSRTFDNSRLWDRDRQFRAFSLLAPERSGFRHRHLAEPVTKSCEGAIALMKKIAAVLGGLVALFVAGGAGVGWY